jgi:hypothetical protein
MPCSPPAGPGYPCWPSGFTPPSSLSCCRCHGPPSCRYVLRALFAADTASLPPFAPSCSSSNTGSVAACVVLGCESWPALTQRKPSLHFATTFPSGAFEETKFRPIAARVSLTSGVGSANAAGGWVPSVESGRHSKCMDSWCPLTTSYYYTWCPLTTSYYYTWCPLTTSYYYTWCPLTTSYYYTWCPLTTSYYYFSPLATTTLGAPSPLATTTTHH